MQGQQDSREWSRKEAEVDTDASQDEPGGITAEARKKSNTNQGMRAARWQPPGQLMPSVTSNEGPISLEIPLSAHC